MPRWKTYYTHVTISMSLVTSYGQMPVVAADARSQDTTAPSPAPSWPCSLLGGAIKVDVNKNVQRLERFQPLQKNIKVSKIWCLWLIFRPPGLRNMCGWWMWPPFFLLMTFSKIIHTVQPYGSTEQPSTYWKCRPDVSICIKLWALPSNKQT